MNKIFPIKSETACLLKWAWSTVFLNIGKTSSCHRANQDKISVDDFDSFHNTPRKIQTREMMRRGEWPEQGCEYCRKIEDTGGTSDRQFQLSSMHYNVPEELIDNPDANEVTPTVLEVYFSNTCNMSCLYCGPHFSSMWEAENNKFGKFQKKETTTLIQTVDRYDKIIDPDNQKVWYRREKGSDIQSNLAQPILTTVSQKPVNKDYSELTKKFFEWLKKHGHKLQHLHILGGEPFHQDELEDCLDLFENYPAPNMRLVLISNLKVNPKKFKTVIGKILKLKENKKIEGLQITGSLDCWGPQQEYIRYGLDLNEFIENFEYLLDKEVNLCMNAAITGLSIKTMPEYILKMNEWNNIRKQHNQHEIFYSFMSANAPPYMMPDIFPTDFFKEDFEKVLSLMKQDTEYQQKSYKHMEGIAKQINNTPANYSMIDTLKIYLDEIDRRRNTNWKELFPWLTKF